MDSVALSIANGARCRTLKFLQIAKVAFVFGFFQALMPLLGFVLGLSFAKFIAIIDHFVAFVILVFLGIKMIMEARDKKEETYMQLNMQFLIGGAIATSIDALAIGITFSFVEINIINACLIIGFVFLILCIVAYYVGKFLGEWLESKALVLGGMILITIGTKILCEHLGYIG